jgi:hypothetical protein
MTDYYQKCKAAAANRGEDMRSAIKEFGGYTHERRAEVLDSFDSEPRDSISLQEAKAEIDKNAFIGTLRRVHHALRRQGR